LKRDSVGGSLASRPFALLCCTMFLGYANQWLLTPVIPLYVSDLGGSALTAGLVLLAFAIPSFTIRPLVGRIADRWNAAGVLAVGLALLATGTLIIVMPLIALLFAGSIVRGLGWAGVNTGGYTRLASAAPAHRRGEAAGYYTSVMTSATILFPALGLWLADARGGYHDVFLLSAGLALAGLPLAVALARGHDPARRETSAPQAHDGSPALIERGVLVATGLNLCSSLVAPSVMAFLPLYARSLGIDRIGWFYVLAGLTSIVVRPVLGRASDRIGRAPAIAIGLGAQFLGFVLILAARDIGLILAGGFFIALGAAMIGSTTTALAMDLAHPLHRGRAMATFSISFQIGAGTGALISGALADLVGFSGMYAGSLVITALGFALLAGVWNTLPRPHGSTRGT
jgi:MFS family permease